ncbi:hypothetical protein BJX99DRAFT_271504 [Aspergillus californicus]
MDTHDVSNISTYLPYLQNHKRTIQNAQSRKGQRPRPTKSRDNLIMQFMARRMSNKAPVGLHAVRSSFVPPSYTPCVTALSDLKKTMIKDLTLETHHRGSYLLVRAVTPTDTMTAVMVIVEDEQADVLMLQLYNQEDRLVADRLVEGSVMIVKEPYLKIMTDGDHGLRVDHLSDVVFLPVHDLRVPSSWRRQLTGSDTSANFWKTKGNDHFNKASYHLAIDCYSQALHSATVDEALTIRLNRALSFLKSHQFDAALNDCEIALSDSTPAPEKALFRKSQALYHLQRFQESCETHQLLSDMHPENTTAKTEFSRANTRLAEQQSGEYRFKQMQLEAKKRSPPLLDRATHVGPVSVKSTKNRGRGLFTTKAVQAGDLLFCEKAFAHAFHDPNDPGQSLALLINAQTDTMTMGTQADLISLIAQKLYKNPSLLPESTDLYHGTYNPITVSEVDNTPVVDTFLIERIITLNDFGCPLSSRDSNLRSTHQKQSDPKFSSCGIWNLASRINHSCYSNARRAFIGDMMIVRATQDIPANTEITFWYKSPLNTDSGDERVPDLQHWGFKCDCVICQDRIATVPSALTKRKTLLRSVLKEFNTNISRKPNLTEIESLLSATEETYRQPASDVPRLSIWETYLTLAIQILNESRGQSHKAIECALKALESLGYIIDGGRLPHTLGTPLRVAKWGIMTGDLVGCWMALSKAYVDVAPDLVTQAVGYARLTYRVCVGEDETFEDDRV